MNTVLLRTFVEVARHGSYARAARALKISQPTAFRHMRMLENDLNGELVAGVGKSIVLTNHGRAALAQAVHVLEEVDRLLHSTLRDNDDLLTGNLEIAVGATLGVSLLPAALVELRRRHPGVSVKMSVLNDRAAIDHAVLHRGFDAGFRSGAIVLGGLDLTPLMEDRLVFIATPDHQLAAKPRIAPEDLREADFIGHARAASPELCAQMESWGLASGVALQSAMEFDDQEAIVAAVMAGGGVSIVSEIVVRRYPHDSLRILPLTPPLARSFFLVQRPKSKLISAIAMLAEIIREFEPAPSRHKIDR